MFTGIIEETGKILSITNNQIIINACKILCDTKLGDSIAINGICLTVTDINKDKFTADISPETFNVTALKYLKTGDLVNLERALPANGRFGGHIVSGHVDSVAQIIKLQKNGNFYDVKIEFSKEIVKYIVKKGSITINGISLTIADINDNEATVAVIPHTFESTTLKNAKTGDFVNIETDILAKYVEKILSTGDNKAGISMEFLKENGF